MRPRIATLAAVAALSCAIGCATTNPQPIVITGHMLDAGGMTFEAVNAAMTSVCPSAEQCRLSTEQVLAWNDFIARWDKGYRSAAKAWKESRAKLDEPAAQQAASLLTSLLGELASWQFVVQGAAR